MIAFALPALLLMSSCHPGQGRHPVSEGMGHGAGEPYGEARGFEIREEGDSLTLLVFDPWNRADTFAVYHFRDSGSAFDRWAVFSTTHIGFLDALGEADRVVGCTTPERIFHPELRKKFDRRELVRIGSDMDYNIESLHQLSPDILIQSAFPGQKSRDARLLHSGIRVIYLMEWLEPTPLGRAEWIKVFGLLVNKRQEADSIYQAVKLAYQGLQAKVPEQTDEERPLVLIGNSFKGTWFLPGGANYQTRLLEDAGMAYPYCGGDDRGSLPFSFEAVLHRFQQAPIWINVAAGSLSDLEREDARYALFSAFEDRQVYAYDHRRHGQSNDYWESGVIHPHLVLEDLIRIAHPGVLPAGELHYYKALQP